MDDPRHNADLAPEAHNSEQDDEGAQAQTVADEALRGGGETLSDSEKVPGGRPRGPQLTGSPFQVQFTDSPGLGTRLKSNSN